MVVEDYRGTLETTGEGEKLQVVVEDYRGSGRLQREVRDYMWK